QASIVANPVLVGAVTTLVTVVAVFLAYNANNGLPFVPTRQINVDTASGANLVKGNEVREGGYRIGVVTRITPVTLRGGVTVSRLELKLDKKVGKIPVDTRVTVRPRSALGLKYVQFERGGSRRYLQDGDTIPLDQTTVPVQFDDVFKIFDTKTRNASRTNLDTFGNAFTGRGTSLNDTIATLPPLFRYLTPVAANLANPGTQLGRFFKELGDAARIVAPIADVNSQVFTDLATTFEAFSRDPVKLQDTIAKSPGTETEGIRSFRVQRPFLRDLADFSTDLKGATHELRGALPIINPALEEGTPILRRSVALNQRTREVFVALRDLVRAPTTNAAITGLSETVGVLNPLVRFLGPYQTVCNYWNYMWTYLAEHLSEGDPTGTAQRANNNTTPTQKNGFGSMGATEPVNGIQSPDQAAQSGSNAVAYLHGQPYWAAINNDGTADCENGQRGYMDGNLSVLGRAKDSTGAPFRIIFDPHTPGSQGPTFTGRSRVPAGETFTREPQNGAQLLPQLTTGPYSGNLKTYVRPGR
ncbi:MAG: MlaD family protein, partial [Actinomycetota bacterium]|nr:MlaD family protein [Actinomycetota bacterium]